MKDVSPSTVNLLDLPPVSESVTFRAYAATLHDEVFLRSVIGKLIRVDPLRHIAVLCRSEAEQERVSTVLGNLPVVIRRTHWLQDLPAVLEFSNYSERNHVALIPLPFLLAPDDMLREAWIYHLEKHQLYTEVSGLPADCSPQLVDCVSLEAILRDSEIAVHSFDELRRLCQVLRANPQAASGDPRLEPSRYVPLDGSTWYQADESRLPSRIPCSTTGAIRVIAPVVFLPFQRDVRTVECASDVHVLVSDEDALGTSILECMSLGKAVLFAGSGGLHEAVIDGVNGLCTQSISCGTTL